jgi:hypothetical protein
VLQTTQGITRMRGTVHSWHGRTVIPTFHPAAILHGGGEKSPQFQDMREDFALVQRTLAGSAEEAAAAEPAPRVAPPPPAAPELVRATPGMAARPEPPVIVPAPADEEQLELF